MKTWRCAILFAVIPLAGGCRVDPNTILVEQELRRQSFEIDRLQAELENAQSDLAASRRENAALRQGSPQGSGRLTLPPGVASPALPLFGGKRPSLSPADEPSIGPPQVVIPPTSQDTPPDTMLRRPSAKPAPLETAPPFVPPGRDSGKPAKPGKDDPTSGAAIRTDSRHVQRISLVPEATRGLNADGRPSDDGVSVMIQTWDAQGRLVQAPGEVSVVVLDRAEQGEAARVARWDFSPQQLADVFRKGSAKDGIYLEMNWPERPPAHDRLHMFVRYTTEDGRSLEADLPLQINQRGQVARRWTQAPPREPEPEPALSPPVVEPPPPESPRSKREPSMPAPPRPERQAERPTWSPYR